MINGISINNKTLVSATFVRFVLVGIVNMVFGYGVYMLLIFLGCHFTIAAMTSTVLGVLFNFKTIGALVFKNSKNSLLFPFIAVYVVGYIINILGIKLFKSYGLNDYYAGAAMLLPLALFSYVLNKKFVFKTSKVK